MELRQQLLLPETNADTDSVLDHGFLRVVGEQCHAERLLAFSCHKRGLPQLRRAVHG